jgi:hypothetical protein
LGRNAGIGGGLVGVGHLGARPFAFAGLAAAAGFAVFARYSNINDVIGSITFSPLHFSAL